MRPPTALTVAIVSFFVVVPTAFAGFSAPTQFDVGTGPETITIGDLNGDGHLDTVTPYSTIGKVSVLLGDGTGSFGNRTDFNVGASPTSIAIANLNSDVDSFPDLAVSNSGSNNISILFGDGTGSFSAPTNISVGTYPVFVAAGKLDADNKSDLVVANQNSGSVSVLIGNGDGTFGATTINTGSGARSVAIGDLDNDSKNDLAVASSGTGNVSILLGAGDGTFETPVDFAAGPNPFSVAMADLDGDGFADLAAASNVYNGGPVAILLGDGTGGFGTATIYSTNHFPRTVAIGNLVGDQSPDLIVANSGSPMDPGTNVSILAGNGDGTFEPKVDYPAGSQPSGVAIGDLDSDQNPDLAVASYGEAKVSVLLNQAPTATASPAGMSFPDQAEGTSSAIQTVLVENTSGGDPMLPDSVSITGPNGTDFNLKGEDCTTGPVNFGEYCEVDLAFEPAAVGSSSAELVITYNGGESPLTVPLSGAGIDVTAPDTLINSGPSGTITTGSATFTFSGSPAADTAKIMCRLDAGAFADCTSPKAFSGLADGSHTVSFRAEDAAGNRDPTLAVRTFTVKKVVPPIPKALIGKVTVKGPAGLKKGRKGTYRVTVTNTGDAVASGVKVKGSGKGVKAVGSAGTIAAGRSKVVTVKVRPKKTGRVKIVFKVTSSNAGSGTVKKTIRVRK